MSDTTCPNVAQHTPTPDGYIEWHSWARTMMAAGAKQRRCPGCSLWAIWSGPQVDIHAFDGWCFGAGQEER